MGLGDLSFLMADFGHGVIARHQELIGTCNGGGTILVTRARIGSSHGRASLARRTVSVWRWRIGWRVGCRERSVRVGLGKGKSHRKLNVVVIDCVTFRLAVAIAVVIAVRA